MNEERVNIGKAAKFLGVTEQTLRNWDASEKLVAKRSPKGTRYYHMDELRRFSFDLS